MSEDRAHDPAALNISWDDSWHGAMHLLPQGAVWPRDPHGVLARTVRGLTGNHWRAWQRVRNMLAESDPRLCFETIDMWEIDHGLPDPCVEFPPIGIQARRNAILAKRQQGSTTTPQQFIDLAAILGYQIEIVEFRPFRTNSFCNDFLNTDIATNDDGSIKRVGWPHTWWVRFINPLMVHWLDVGGGTCVEPLRTWQFGEDLICIIERIKPAHTTVIYGLNITP